MATFPTEMEFKELRDATRSPLPTGEGWPKSCQFLMDAIKDGHAWFHVYRAHPDEYEINADLAKGLWAIDREENILRWHHLKHLRRFYFQRYAFGRACSISRRIWKGEQENFFWLYKDVLLLRAALALFLGYALVFGAGSTCNALRLLAHEPHWQRIVTGSAVFLVALIYLNARNQAGRGKHLVLRALAVATGTGVWATAYCWGASQVFGAIHWHFCWPEAAMVSSAAVPLSILAQFFFGSDRSLTDPL
jgi:hypothetical protein